MARKSGVQVKGVQVKGVDLPQGKSTPFSRMRAYFFRSFSLWLSAAFSVMP
jgi:hypothetical protein